MNNIVNIKYNEELYNSLFIKKFNNKDLLGALLITNSIEKLPSFDRQELAVKRARVFYYMQEYSLACNEWFKYLSLTNDKKLIARAYNGLGACFYKLNDLKLARYYFNAQLSSDMHALFEYSSVTAEFYQEILSVEKNYYLAYPYEKADFTNALERADEYLKIGEVDKVIELLKEVPASSKQYSVALVTLSIAKYFLGEIEDALVDIEKSIEIEDSIIAICNAISMFFAVENKEKVEYYLNLLKQKDIIEDDDVYKATMVYLEQGEDELAYNLAQKYLKNNKYNLSMLLLVGILNYNNANYDKAEQLFKKAYQISNSYIFRYYLKISQNKSYKKLSYTLDLQDKDRAKIVKKISEFLKLESDIRKEFEDEILEISSYAISTSVYQIQSTAVALLGELNTNKSLEFIKKMLISLDIYDRVKAGALGFLVASGVEGEVGAVFSSIYKSISIYKAVFDDNKVFNEAYAYAFSKVAPLERDTLKLKESAENIYNTLKEKEMLGSVQDVKALAALMFELSGIKKILSRREFAKFFSANLREIKKIKEMLGQWH